MRRPSPMPIVAQSHSPTPSMVDGSVLERAGKKGTGRMGLVMTDEGYGFVVPSLQGLSDLARKMQFDLEPLGHGFEEGSQPDWGKGEVGFQKPFEF